MIEINGRRTIYVDNVATSLKPCGVIGVLCGAYEHHRPNIDRGGNKP